MSPDLEKACNAATEAEAVKILTESGYTPRAARETAAIMFGTLGGDIVGDGPDVSTAEGESAS